MLHFFWVTLYNDYDDYDDHEDNSDDVVYEKDFVTIILNQR